MDFGVFILTAAVATLVGIFISAEYDHNKVTEPGFLTDTEVSDLISNQCTQTDVKRFVTHHNASAKIKSHSYVR